MDGDKRLRPAYKEKDEHGDNAKAIKHEIDIGRFDHWYVF